MRTIRLISGFVAAAFVLSLGMSAQDLPKPQLSKEPLTSEQVAVYRAVLEYYVKDGAVGVLNVANRTEPLDQSGFWSNSECFKGFEPPAKTSAPVVHMLDSSLGLDRRFALVDPDSQQKKVEENDPQKLVHRAIDEGEKVTDRQLNDSVKRAFETGLFTLSEIRFDKQHRQALVSYSFVCGELCGHGNLLIVTKDRDGWKVSKTCGSWIS